MSDVVSPASATGVRARVRAELTREIKELGRAQLESEGAAQISLRKIARDLGMASSAIYRYFASRDELLTALIIDAFRSLADAAEEAERVCDRQDRVGRVVAVCHAVRRWAIDHTHEYALIYGSPVPGYEAPQDTIDQASRVPTLLVTPIIEHYRDRVDVGDGSDAGSESLAESIAGLLGFVDHQVPAPVLARAVEAWAELFGYINLELFGHFENTITDTEAFFAHAVEHMVGRAFE